MGRAFVYPSYAVDIYVENNILVNFDRDSVNTDYWLIYEILLIQITNSAPRTHWEIYVNVVETWKHDSIETKNKDSGLFKF